MENKLIELSRTSKHIYIVVCLPVDAYDIKHGLEMTFPDNAVYFRSDKYCKGNLDSEDISFNFEILGLLNELKEEQAREIVYSRGSEQKYPFLNYMNVLYYFESALESLTSKVESNGISTTENKILILKAEI
jgi:hypothetical protein